MAVSDKKCKRKNVNSDIFSPRNSCRPGPGGWRVPARGSAGVSAAGTPAWRALVAAVAAESGIPADDLLGRRRQPRVARARHLLCWCARDRLGWSYPKIGRVLGRDHTTVLHAVRMVAADRGLLDRAPAVYALIPPPQERACRVCGCTDARACVTVDGVPCHWIAADLCSACAAADEVAA